MFARSPREPLLILAILLLVGLSWLGFGSGLREVPVGVPVAPGVGSGSAQALEGLSVVAAPATEGDPARRELALPTSAAQAPPAPRSGVTGRVVDPRGRPVPDATVRARSGVPLDIPPDLEPGARLPHWLNTDGIKESRTRTGPDGLFALQDELDAGITTLLVEAEGFATLREVGRRLPRDRPYDLGELVLNPGVRLSGRVVDPFGAALEGVQVLAAIRRGVNGATLSLPGRGILLGETDAEGHFDLSGLAHGPWALLLDSPLHVLAEQRGHTRQPGEHLSELLFVLQPGLDLSGRVAGVGTDDGRLRVEARPLREFNGGDASEPAVRRARTTPVQDDGTFLLRGLAPDSHHELSLWRETEQGEWITLRIVAGHEVKAGTRNVLLRASPPARVTLTVLDAQGGEPIESLMVWRSFSRSLDDDDLLQEPEGGGPRRVFEGGRVRLEGLDASREGRTLGLMVRAEGFEDLRMRGLALVPGETLELGQRHMTPRAQLELRVVDGSSGEPVPGALVFTGDQLGEGDIRHTLRRPQDSLAARPGITVAVSDAEGLARLPIDEDEQWHVGVRREGYAPAGPLSFSGAGLGTVQTVTLARGGSLLVRVLDGSSQPVEGAVVGLASVGASQNFKIYPHQVESRDVRTGPEGTLLLETLIPGEWAVAAMFRDESQLMSDSGRVQRVLILEGGQHEVQLTAAAMCVLRGRVSEAGAALAGAEVRLYRVGASRRRRDSWQTSYGIGGLIAWTGPGGEFCMREVDEGAYVLTIGHPSRYMSYRSELTLVPESEPLLLDLPVSVLAGRISLPDDSPLEGVNVSVSFGGWNNARWRGRSATLEEEPDGDIDWGWESNSAGSVRTAHDGSYQVRGVRPDQDLVISVRGEFTSSGSKRDITLAPGEYRGGVDFILKATGRLVVRCQAAEGRENLRLYAWSKEHMTTLSRGVRAGRPVTLSGVAPGSWTVTLQERKPGPDEVLASAPVEVQVGQTARLTLIEH